MFHIDFTCISRMTLTKTFFVSLKKNLEEFKKNNNIILDRKNVNIAAFFLYIFFLHKIRGNFESEKLYSPLCPLIYGNKWVVEGLENG